MGDCYLGDIDVITSTPWKKRQYAFILSIVVAALGYLAFSLWGGWREVLAAINAIGVFGILIALVLSLINYSLRFVRWQNFLHALDYSIPVVPSGLIYLSGFALTTTPGKAGEMLRGVFLKARGMSYTQSTAAFLSERLSDLVAIVLLALFGAVIFPQGTITISTGVAFVGLGLLFLSRRKWLLKLDEKVCQQESIISIVSHRLLLLLVEASRCHSVKLLFVATVLSLLAWSAEAYAFHLILQQMGIEISLPVAFSIYALSMLAGAISFLPGGLGGAEVVMVGLLMWTGIPEAQAVAATVIIRLATLWFAVALGGAVLLMCGRVLRGDIDYVRT